MSAIALNLRRIRQLRGFTQGQLAEAANISRNAYRAIETGSSQPRQGNLQKLAEALQVSTLELVREIPELKSLRFRCHKTMTAQQKAKRAQLVSEAAVWLRDFSELEDMLGDTVPFELGEVRRGRRAVDTIASEVREALGLDADKPVADICDLVENAGIKLYDFESELENVFGFSVGPIDGGPAIGVNVRDDISVERRIFTVAHELGHLVLHAQSYGDDALVENMDHEKEANLFAGHFLMPLKEFERVWGESRGLYFVDRVMKAKRYFLVSFRTVLMRLVASEVVDENIWAKFHAMFERRYGRRLAHKEEPFPVAQDIFANKETKAGEPSPLENEDFSEDRLDRLVRKAVENRVISRSRGAEVLGISMSEMRDLIDNWRLAE